MIDPRAIDLPAEVLAVLACDRCGQTGTAVVCAACRKLERDERHERMRLFEPMPAPIAGQIMLEELS